MPDGKEESVSESAIRETNENADGTCNSEVLRLNQNVSRTICNTLLLARWRANRYSRMSRSMFSINKKDCTL